MTKSLFIVAGLTLFLIGSVLYITSPPVSESDAIQRTARVTRGKDGQMMYTITGAEIRNAAQQRDSTNIDRTNKRQIGMVLAIPGSLLLIVGVCIGSFKQNVAEDEL